MRCRPEIADCRLADAQMALVEAQGLLRRINETRYCAAMDRVFVLEAVEVYIKELGESG